MKLLIIIFLLAASPFLSANAQETAPAKPTLVQQGETTEGEKVYELNVNKGARITSVLRQLSGISGINIYPAPEVRGTVEEGHFKGTIEEILDDFLEAAGYTYVREENRIKVILMESVTKIFRLKYLDAYKVKSALQAQLSPGGSISVLSTSQPGWAFGGTGGASGTTGGTGGGIGIVSKRTRTTPGLERSSILIVSDVPSVLDRIEKIIYELDRKPQQILIEAKVVEVSLGDEARLGIQWSYVSPSDNPEEHNLSITGLFPRTLNEEETNVGGMLLGGEFSFGTLTAENYIAVLDMLAESKNSEILSSPRIMALDNQEATILTGTQEPILKTEITGTIVTGGVTQSVFGTTLDQYISIGTQLLVIPQVAGDGYINMVIHPEVSEKIGETETNPSYPIIGTREADTQVLIKSGETVVVGGLVKNEKTKETAKFPILGDIPLVGLLFRRSTNVDNKSELLIFITPHLIVDGSPVAEPQPAPAAEAKLPPVQEPQPTAVESKPSVEAALPPAVEPQIAPIPAPVRQEQPVPAEKAETPVMPEAPQPAPTPEPQPVPVSEIPPVAAEQPPPAVDPQPVPVPQPVVEVQPVPVAAEEPSPPVETPPVVEPPPAEPAPAPEVPPQQIDEPGAAAAFKESLDAIEKGDYNGASELLKRAIALNPNEPKYQEHLARLQKTMEILGKE